MPNLNKRIRAIHAFYNEITLAEEFFSKVGEDDFDCFAGMYFDKAQRHLRSAEKLAAHITLQFKSDINSIPDIHDFLKPEETYRFVEQIDIKDDHNLKLLCKECHKKMMAEERKK